jgi:hypothetical protein
MKDLDDLHFFLGMEVERDGAQHLLYIKQIGYFKEIRKRFRMEDYKAIGVPLDPKTKLKKNVNKNGEGSLSISRGIFDACHVVYSVGLGIPNKRGELTHG